MRFIEIKERFLTAELSPEDCLLLARACETQTENDSGHNQTYDLFTSAFEAAALAAGTYSQANLEDHVSLSGLRAEKMFTIAKE